MKPRIPITDPAFRYTPAVETNVKRTWANARRRMAAENEQERLQKVMPIKRKA